MTRLGPPAHLEGGESLVPQEPSTSPAVFRPWGGFCPRSLRLCSVPVPRLSSLPVAGGARHCPREMDGLGRHPVSVSLAARASVSSPLGWGEEEFGSLEAEVG